LIGMPFIILFVTNDGLDDFLARKRTL